MTPLAREGSTIVVLDKDPFFREFLRFLLTQQGFHVEAPTEDPEFSAAYVAAQKPALLITEILLPRLDGLQLVAELKKEPATRDLRVIVFSVLRAEERARRAGADRFVQKPVMRENFMRVVQDALGGGAVGASLGLREVHR